MAKSTDPLTPALVTLRRLVRTLPGAEEYTMVHHPAFRVGKKPFAIVGMDESTTLSINLGTEAQGDLLSDPRFSRTHYIGQHGWVTVDFPRLTAGEVTSLIEGSWQRVAGKKHLAAHADGSDGKRAPATAKPATAKPATAKGASSTKKSPPAKVSKRKKTSRAR